jgi:excinuclease ABC subunit C
MTLQEKVAGFPRSPGVYLMKEADGKVLYIGKANDLRKRVSSYLKKEEKSRYQVAFLMKRVADIDFMVTDSEKEALLLENNLIKKYHPRYNLQLRDDKSYLSLKLSVKDQFPRIYVTRPNKKDKKDGAVYFGPYTSASAARETVEFLEKQFRLRTCSDAEFANRVRPCLQYQIHRCDAPCVGLIDQARYQEVVEQVKFFLQGKKKDLLKTLEREMQEQSTREEFEKAAQARDLIASIKETLEKQKVDRHSFISQDAIGFHREGEQISFCVLMIREGKVWESRLFHLKGLGEDDEVLESFLAQFYKEDRFTPDEILVPLSFSSPDTLGEILDGVKILNPKKGDRSDLIDLAARNAREGFSRRSKKEEETREVLGKLQEILHLQNFPRRMEGFDISNISGQQAVGSLVAFVDGLPFKDGYRRFKIKTVHQPDDFSMMKEVLKRRLLRINDAEENSKWEKPNLMVIDGGKGQLNAVLAVLAELNVTGIDLISLAKEREGENQDKVFLPGRKNPVLLGRHSNLLHLLMRLRDEAHRFAITYHKKLRSKAFLPSVS